MIDDPNRWQLLTTEYATATPERREHINELLDDLEADAGAGWMVNKAQSGRSKTGGRSKTAKTGGRSKINERSKTASLKCNVDARILAEFKEFIGDPMIQGHYCGPALKLWMMAPAELRDLVVRRKWKEAQVWIDRVSVKKT